MSKKTKKTNNPKGDRLDGDGILAADINGLVDILKNPQDSKPSDSTKTEDDDIDWNGFP